MTSQVTVSLPPPPPPLRKMKMAQMYPSHNSFLPEMIRVLLHSVPFYSLLFPSRYDLKLKIPSSPSPNQNQSSLELAECLLDNNSLHQESSLVIQEEEHFRGQQNATRSNLYFPRANVGGRIPSCIFPSHKYKLLFSYHQMSKYLVTAVLTLSLPSDQFQISPAALPETLYHTV